MATIRERRGKNGKITWQVLHKTRGKQTSFTFHGYPAALRFLATLEDQGLLAAKREALDPYGKRLESPPLDAYLARYIDLLTDATIGTREGYRTIAEKSIIAELGNPRIADIDRPMVATAVNRLTARLAPKTVRNVHGFLSAALEQAFRDGLIPSNPARGLRLPKKPPSNKPVLTDDEFEALVDALPEHYRPLVLVLAETGMRWSEATALNVEDVDLRARLLRVTHAWKRTVGSQVVREGPKSTAGTRTITLYPQTVETLRPLVAGKKRGQLVFTTPKGTRVTHAHFYDRVWKPACETAGLEPRPGLHALRHGHATWMVSTGVPLAIVQVRLGHEDIRTTIGTYAHVTPEIQRAAMDAVAPRGQISAG